MRILFLSHRLPYAPNRGDRIRAHHLLRHLASRHEVHVVSLVHDATEMAHARDLEEVVASVRVARVPRARNLVAAIAALPGDTPLTHVLLHSGEIRPILEDVVRSSPPDLVIAYCSGMAAHAVAAPLRGIPFLLDMVDADSQKWADLSRVARWPRKWIYQREARCLEAFERTAMSQAIATTVVSDKESAALERIAPGARTVVVQNGVDLTAFSSPGPPATASRVVFCGVFNYEPNETGALWLANEVWPLVTRHVASAELVLVGMSPSRRVLALADRPSIRVTGSVPDVRPYLWEAAVAVAPLHIGSKLLFRRSLWPKRFLAAAAHVIGVRARLSGEALRPHSLLISNHVSWLDILILGGTTGTAFVSKDNLGHGVIHWLADQNATLYVRREDRRNSKAQALTIAKALEGEQPLSLFPEGTTGPGDHLLPFRSTLLAAATYAEKDVQIRPVALDYGAAATEVGWFHEPGKDNILRILGRRGTLPVTVNLLEPLAHGDRKSLANAARNAIAETLASSREPTPLYADR